MFRLVAMWVAVGLVLLPVAAWIVWVGLCTGCSCMAGGFEDS